MTAAATALAALLLAAATAMALAAPPTELPAMPGGDTGDAGGGDDPHSGGTVPSLPVEWQPMSCDFNLGGIGFGGVDTACTPPHHHHHHHRHHHHFDLRLRCCPVLATWLYAAQADSAVQGAAAAAAAPPSSSSAQQQQQVEMPVPPDDSSVCAAELQEGLSARGLDFPQINGSCDFSLCYCGIRLRQIASLECPVPYFASSNSSSSSSSPSPAPAPAPGVLSSSNEGATILLPSSRSPYLRRLESACSDPSHAGCGACIEALDNAVDWGEKKTSSSRRSSNNVRSDCRIMGLMWLLAQNSTRYAATASAVIRAVVYNEQRQCSLDEAAMPLADGTTTTAELDIASSASSSVFSPSSWSPLAAASILGLGLMILV